MTTGLVGRLRRDAGRVKRWLAPRREIAAWRQACRAAEQTPRYTPGEIALLEYTIQYSDLLTLCPQWHEIFVRRMLAFSTTAPAPRILDCGANVGLASLFFKRLHPSALITAFEPDPALHAMLVANLERNGAADVRPVHAALWTTNGDIAFTCEGGDSGAISQVANGVAGRECRVSTRRLHDLLADEPVDLLKLDIEGAELAVLADCELVLRQAAAIVIDVHEFDPQARVLPHILGILERAGFIYTLDTLELQPWKEPIAGADTPFPRAPLCWTLLVRAWRR